MSEAKQEREPNPWSSHDLPRVSGTTIDSLKLAIRHRPTYLREHLDHTIILDNPEAARDIVAAAEAMAADVVPVTDHGSEQYWKIREGYVEMGTRVHAMFWRQASTDVLGQQLGWNSSEEGDVPQLLDNAESTGDPDV